MANHAKSTVKISGVKHSRKPKTVMESGTQTRFDDKSFHRAAYRTKQTIFQQGDIARSVYYIETGGVHLSVVSKQGKEAVVAMLGAGEFFGEGCLAGQVVQSASAMSQGISSILTIGKAEMILALHEHRALSERFVSYLVSRNIEIQADLVDQLFNSSERRLARVLLLLANFGKGGKMTTIPKISQDVLAGRVGTTRSRINFFMNKFRKLGLIEYNGGLKVNSSLLNIIVQDQVDDAPAHGQKRPQGKKPRVRSGLG